MRNILLASVVAATWLALTSCRPPGPGPGPFTSGCPLERLNWMEASEGYDSKTVIELATKIEAAAKADAAKLKELGNVDASTSASFSSALKSTIENSSKATTKVSQEFYERYLANRSALCALYQAIRDGRTIYSDPGTRVAAEDAYTKVALSFAQVAEAEKKRSGER